MIIRPRTPDDRAACHHVYYRAVREGAAAFYTEAQRAAWAPTPKPDLTTPDPLADMQAWVAEDNGAITGFMAIDNSGYIDLAFVLPEAMGRGVATALYEQVLIWGKDQGFPRLTVAASHLAQRFFTKHGWHVVEREMHPAHGQVFERFQMALDLKGLTDD